MKIIVHAEPEEMDYVVSLVLASRKDFACHPQKIGWGWSFGQPGKRSFFIRQIKDGLSARPVKEPA